MTVFCSVCVEPVSKVIIGISLTANCTGFILALSTAFIIENVNLLLAQVGL